MNRCKICGSYNIDIIIENKTFSYLEKYKFTVNNMKVIHCNNCDNHIYDKESEEKLKKISNQIKELVNN